VCDKGEALFHATHVIHTNGLLINFFLHFFRCLIPFIKEKNPGQETQIGIYFAIKQKNYIILSLKN
jgi:hypothetical protein